MYYKLVWKFTNEFFLIIIFFVTFKLMLTNKNKVHDILPITMGDTFVLCVSNCLKVVSCVQIALEY